MRTGLCEETCQNLACGKVQLWKVTDGNFSDGNTAGRWQTPTKLHAQNELDQGEKVPIGPVPIGRVPSLSIPICRVSMLSVPSLFGFPSVNFHSPISIWPILIRKFSFRSAPKCVISRYRRRQTEMSLNVSTAELIERTCRTDSCRFTRKVFQKLWNFKVSKRGT